MTIADLYPIFLEHRTICTDSRAISSGCLFFALKGEKFDGNTFAIEAINQGAAYSIVDNKALTGHAGCIVVNNVLQTLQDLAKYHRSKINIPVIGITGSNGKTTTKELLYSVLDSRFNTFATKGNLNNHIGVPLSVLAIQSQHDIAIIEMGANHIGEIAALCEISQPDIGIITNIGRAHLEGFGSPEGILQAKTELYSFVCKKNGILFVNSNDHLLIGVKDNFDCTKILYGSFNETLVKSKVESSNPFLSLWLYFDDKSEFLVTNLAGNYNEDNILATVSIGLHFGIDIKTICKKISEYKPQNQRSQVINKEYNLLICDYYNANPSSMELALKNFAQMNFEDKGKVVMLGEMKELGKYSDSEHQKIVNLLFELEFSECFLVGACFFDKTDLHNFKVFENALSLAKYLNENKLYNKAILIKGSRGAEMEKVVDFL